MDLPESLPERLYLLTYDTQRQRIVFRSRLGFLLRAGILAELLLQGHLADATGGPTAKTPALADPLFDKALQEIASSRRRTWQHWVAKGGRDAVRDVRDRLEAGRWIRVEHRRVLGIFPTTKVTVRDTRVVKRLVAMVSTAMRSGRPTSRLAPRDAALAALAATVRLKTVLPKAQWRAAGKRSDELAQVVAPVPRALHKAIQAADAAATSGG